MKETIALIDQVIEEHTTIFQGLDQVVSDAEAIYGFKEAQEIFTSDRLDQKEWGNRLVELVNSIDQGLQAHFDREETALMAAFEGEGDRELASNFRSLMLEHSDLRNRLAHAKRHVSELTGGESSRSHWRATAHNLHAHIDRTRELMKAHAGAEQKLLLSLRQRLLEEEYA
jgi:iron-sulfur cluster repair protein YtfE (RIC family)